MKVLFVSSENSSKISPIVSSQLRSLESKGIKIQYYGIKGKGTLGYLRNIFPLYQKIKNIKPDIIHAHYGLSALVALLTFYNQPLIVSFMGDDILGSNDNTGGITKRSYFLTKLNIWLSNNVYRYTFVKSQQMRSRLSNNRVVIIPNGVDIQLFEPQKKNESRKKLKIPSNEKIAIFVSNPSRPEKNFMLALQAIEKYNERKVRLIPIYNLDQKDLVLYYNASDLLVLPSFHEGSPNVVKEAMACNCPVVATDVGDVKWLFGNSEGHYLSDFDPEDFATKIKFALKFREENGFTTGRQRLIDLGLDSETVAKRIINVYEEVLR